MKSPAYLFRSSIPRDWTVPIFWVLKEHDVKVITDLMMGGDGTNTDGELGGAASECNFRGDEPDDGAPQRLPFLHCCRR